MTTKRKPARKTTSRKPARRRPVTKKPGRRSRKRNQSAAAIAHDRGFASMAAYNRKKARGHGARGPEAAGRRRSKREHHPNGGPVRPGWHADMRAAQRKKTVTLCGRRYTRIRFGRETGAGFNRLVPGDSCGDCGAMYGWFHDPGCDIEVCPRCGGQAITCNCRMDLSGYIPGARPKCTSRVRRPKTRSLLRRR